MSALDIRDLAWGLLPGEVHRVIAVLFAYFDESGTDCLLGHTVISGFVGSSQAWGTIQGPWREELARVGAWPFHCVECVWRNKAYSHFKDRQQSLDHLNAMAAIVAPHDVIPVAASFSGNWEQAVAKHEDDFGTRFPSAYSFCFEAVVEQLNRYSERFWNSEPIAMIFSEQDQYSSRAIEVYAHFKHNGEWQNIIHCGYADPRSVVPLQVADMISWETRRYLWKREEDPDAWVGMPLLNRLIEYQGELAGWAYDDESIQTVRAQSPRRFLKRPPEYQAEG